MNPHVGHVYWIGFPSVNESVSQARQRQGQGQGLLLYWLQAEAAEFMKKEKELTVGVKKALTPAVCFTGRHGHLKKKKVIMEIKK